MEKAKQTRRPKGQRDRKERKKTYKYVPCDGLILQFLAKYRYLRSPYLYEMCNEYSKSWVIERISILNSHGFIVRHNKQEDEERMGWNYSLTWEIEPKGFDLLDDHIPQVTSLSRMREDMPRSDDRHSMMICDGLGSIDIGMQKDGLPLITQEEIIAKSTAQFPMRLPVVIDYKGKYHPDEALIPDTIFRIPYPEIGQRQFGLEAQYRCPLEVTDLTRASFIKKVLGYTERATRTTTENGKTKLVGFSQLGRKHMHVLFLFPTKKRMQSAIELVERMDAMPENPLRGMSSMFLFQVQHVPRHAYECPKPRPELFTGEWLRAGLPPISLKDLPYEVKETPKA